MAQCPLRGGSPKAALGPRLLAGHFGRWWRCLSRSFVFDEILQQSRMTSPLTSQQLVGIMDVV